MAFYEVARTEANGATCFAASQKNHPDAFVPQSKMPLCKADAACSKRCTLTPLEFPPRQQAGYFHALLDRYATHAPFMFNCKFSTDFLRQLS